MMRNIATPKRNFAVMGKPKDMSDKNAKTYQDKL
jgi:hypothetical protein